MGLDMTLGNPATMSNPYMIMDNPYIHGAVLLGGVLFVSFVFVRLMDWWCERDREKARREIEETDSRFREMDERADREYNERLLAAIVGDQPDEISAPTAADLLAWIRGAEARGL